MKGLIGITGTPGTGKKTIAPLVASSISFSAADLNQMIVGFCSPEEGRSLQVDTSILRRRVKAMRFERSVVFGHLLPYAFQGNDLDFVAVLRCRPDALKKRLRMRGYSSAKVLENVEAELIGLILSEALKTFGSRMVHEYDTTSAQPTRVAEAIARDFMAGKPNRVERVDWTSFYDSPATLRSLLSTDRTESAST